MQTTIEARDADPPRQIAAPVHDLHRPFVMTANIRGGDDRNRQNLGVGDLRPHITAMPQVFHQRVDHDKSRYHPIGVRRLLLAMMLVGQPRSCQSCRWSSTSNQGQVCKKHVRQNTAALVENLSALIRAGKDHSLEPSGMSPEQALADLDNLSTRISTRTPDDQQALEHM